MSSAPLRPGRDHKYNTGRTGPRRVVFTKTATPEHGDDRTGYRLRATGYHSQFPLELAEHVEGLHGRHPIEVGFLDLSGGSGGGVGEELLL